VVCNALTTSKEEVGMMMFGHGGHWAVWQVGAMGIVMIAVLGLLVWAAYTLIRNANQGSNREERRDDPRRTLDERLANGEIDEEEYKRLCSLIAGENRVPVGDN
jgi:uncharacterized membrane protein